MLAPAFQGFGDSIPPFLRFDGPVKNKKPSKKEVVNLLKDAWKERTAEEQVSSRVIKHSSCKTSGPAKEFPQDGGNTVGA